MAALAPSSVFIVANAKPRARPVSLSMTTWISFTGPCGESMSRRSFSVTSKERFPTYSFELIINPGLDPLLLPSCSRCAGFKSSLKINSTEDFPCLESTSWLKHDHLTQWHGEHKLYSMFPNRI